MADDRSLTDVIRFLDPSGDLTDADIAALSRKLKFTDVLDIITYVGKDELTKARELLTKYDDRFSVAQEYAVPPTPPGKIGGGVAKKSGGFKPIRPIGTAPTIAQAPTNPNGQQTGQQAQVATQDDAEAQELDDLMTNPATKNKPEVQQIARLLQRMNR